MIAEAKACVGPRVSAQRLRALVTVALNEGCSLTEIARAGGASLSTTSRHLLDLGSETRKGEPGCGLVDQRPDPIELRRNSYTLTPKGRDAIGRLTSALMDQPGSSSSTAGEP